MGQFLFYKLNLKNKVLFDLCHPQKGYVGLLYSLTSTQFQWGTNKNGRGKEDLRIFFRILSGESIKFRKTIGQIGRAHV